MLLYIHIPFCDSKCHYCSFNSYTNLFKYKKEYFKAIEKQLLFDIEKYNINMIDTLFIGGGTPSSVEANYYKNIFNILKQYNFKEITIEANPNSATYDWQKEIFDFGVDRISFGVQSFNEQKLKYLGRNHNKSQAIKAIEIAKKIGFRKINCDIIYDTILDNSNIIENDLNIIKNLPINHISCYSLTIENDTLFDKNKEKTKQNLDLTLYIFNELKEIGFYQYEISNFAKDEFFSLHNKGYWKLSNYLGIGSGGVGFIDNFRYYPDKNVIKYIKNPTYKYFEYLDNNDIKLEKIFLGFRSDIGVDLDIFNQQELKKIDILVDENKVYIKNNKVYNKDYLLSDEICLFVNG